MDRFDDYNHGQHDQQEQFHDHVHQQHHGEQQFQPEPQYQQDYQHDHQQDQNHHHHGFSVEQVEHIHEQPADQYNVPAEQHEMPQQQYNVLDDDEMNLPEEQSLEERENIQNLDRLRDLQTAPGVGFMRKLNSAAYGKKFNDALQSKVDQAVYSTLDEKARLRNELKSLAQYERKGNNIQPIVQPIDAHPVILIRWDSHNSRFELNDEAVRLFQSGSARKNAKVSFVSIVGPKESGKTFLINSLLEVPENGQKLQNSEQYQNSLIMWSQPIYDPTTDCEVYFLDLQTEWDESNPLREKLFFFQCIISTVLIYNVRSNQLKNQDFSELRSLLHMQNHFEFDRLDLKEDLKYLMPRLHVVMRDFTHEINRQGHTVSGQQFLEEFLFDDSHVSKNNTEQELKIRRRIIKYFTDRDLSTMIVPIPGTGLGGAPKEISNNINASVINNRSKINNIQSRIGANPVQVQHTAEELTAQERLRNLNWVPHDEIDALFKLETASLRKKLIAKSDVRSIRGLRFSKNMMVQYILSFLEDSNANEKFDFDKAIQILLENEFITVYHECIDLYKHEMTQQFGNTDFMSMENMTISLRRAREQVYYNFFQLKAHDIDQAEQLFAKYYELLKRFISEMEQQFQTINNDETHRVVSEIIQERLAVVRQKTCNGQFRVEDIQFISQEFESLLQQVKLMCIGQTSEYGETYGIFVTQIQKLMMDTILKEIGRARINYAEELEVLKKEKEALKVQHEKALSENNELKKNNEKEQKKKDQAAAELAQTLKQEAEANSKLNRHKGDIDNIKWLTSRYQKAQQDKTC